MKKLLVTLIVLSFILSNTNAQEFIGFDGYTVSDEVITRQEWDMAVSHRDEYNCHLDTTDRSRYKEAAEAVLRTFDDWEMEFYGWTDSELINNSGTFLERGETIVEILYEHHVEAVFVDNGIADTCHMVAAICGTYSKDGVYVGAQGFDCDGCVDLFFYRHVESSGPCHIQFMGEYKCKTASHLSEEDPQENPLVWYGDCLYWKGYSRYNRNGDYGYMSELVYHKLTIKESQSGSIGLITKE